jgi:hypothetical protein
LNLNQRQTGQIAVPAPFQTLKWKSKQANLVVDRYPKYPLKISIGEKGYQYCMKISKIVFAYLRLKLIFSMDLKNLARMSICYIHT